MLVFIEFEHSDGYNYVHGSALYYYPIATTRNGKWSLVGAVGGGAGILYPKTRVEISDQATNSPRVVDNKMGIAGYGVDVEAKLRLRRKKWFLEASSRHVLGKINNAPFLGSEGSISQSPIYSAEFILGGGFQFRTGKNNK